MRKKNKRDIIHLSKSGIKIDLEHESIEFYTFWRRVFKMVQNRRHNEALVLSIGK